MPSWLEVDVDGLRKTLSRKGKVWALHELIQNSWDAEATRVDVTLTRPKNGTSTLTCIDDAPGGFANLTHAHTLFAESDKKNKATKRGRFSAGDKYVLALMRQATVTSTTGQIVFQSNGQRKTHDEKRTEVGSEFKGVLNMTDEDYDDMMSKVFAIIPPANIPTFINGQQVAFRKPVHTFKVKLPTELADDAGILRSRKRETIVNLYAAQDGEKATLYEMGIPVVPVDENLRWHVDIGQKVPLNIERDNVTPSYLRDVYNAVLAEKVNELSEEEASAAWITTAMESPKASKETLQGVITKRFGSGAVRRDYSDKGSNREAQSQDRKVVERAAFPKAVWENLNKQELLPKAGDVCPTDFACLVPTESFPPNRWTPAMKAYTDFLTQMAPILIDHTVTVEYIKDSRVEFRGCTRWKKGSFILEINLEYHDVTDWLGNVYLMLHEFAHHKVQSNDHLWKVFYYTVNVLGAKLVKLAVQQPALFPFQFADRDTSDIILEMMERRFEGLKRETLHEDGEIEGIAA
jgi:hypothetical protein